MVLVPLRYLDNFEALLLLHDLFLPSLDLDLMPSEHLFEHLDLACLLGDLLLIVANRIGFEPLCSLFLDPQLVAQLLILVDEAADVLETVLKLLVLLLDHLIELLGDAVLGGEDVALGLELGD